MRDNYYLKRTDNMYTLVDDQGNQCIDINYGSHGQISFVPVNHKPPDSLEELRNFYDNIVFVMEDLLNTPYIKAEKAMLGENKNLWSEIHILFGDMGNICFSPINENYNKVDFYEAILSFMNSLAISQHMK